MDNFFDSAPFLLRMRKKGNVPIRGGRDIRTSHIYGGFDATSYGRGDEFNTEVKEYALQLVFDWKFSYAPVNLNVIDVDLNDSPEQTFDLVDAAMETAELSLINDLATQIFADGTGNANKDIDGLAIAVSRTGTYGNLARGTDAQGDSIRCAFEDTTGGAVALATMNTNYGTAIVANEAPDLVVTTQTLWNRVWERSQPSERNAPEATRDIGFRMVRFNAADVVADSHTPSGFMYTLNTKWFSLFTHRKWDFRFRGFAEPTNQQLMVGQIIAWCNLVCRSPRLQGVASGLS